MNIELLSGLSSFALVSSITPGPNNMMLMASGANFGLRRTLPHMLGVSLGHGFMTFIIGIGLGELFKAYPIVRMIMMITSCIYLLYLAWRTANAASPSATTGAGKPLTFLQAAAFQWINPKAVYMSITAQTNFAPEGGGWLGAAMVAGIFLCINFVSISTWTVAGTYIREWLSTPSRLKVFNYTMAILLCLTLVPIIRTLILG